VVDRDLMRAEDLCRRLSAEFGGEVEVRASSDAAKAVEGKDVICCATTAREPVFPADALAEHAHVNAIGAFRPTMREVPEQLLAESVIVVDEREAALEEAGEIIDALASGAIQEEDLVELGVALQSPPAALGRTVFKSVGVAVQDWAIADLLARRSVQ
jgi:ornithine cyclodeaminase